jgi:hypothetical protein
LIEFQTVRKSGTTMFHVLNCHALHPAAETIITDPAAEHA